MNVVVVAVVAAVCGIGVHGGKVHRIHAATERAAVAKNGGHQYQPQQPTLKIATSEQVQPFVLQHFELEHYTMIPILLYTCVTVAVGVLIVLLQDDLVLHAERAKSTLYTLLGFQRQDIRRDLRSQRMDADILHVAPHDPAMRASRAPTPTKAKASVATAVVTSAAMPPPPPPQLSKPEEPPATATAGSGSIFSTIYSGLTTPAVAGSPLASDKDERPSTSTSTMAMSASDMLHAISSRVEGMANVIAAPASPVR